MVLAHHLISSTLIRKYFVRLIVKITTNVIEISDFERFGPLLVPLSTYLIITLHLPSCLGQETANGPFGLRVKLPPAHASTTHGGGFTMSFNC